MILWSAFQVLWLIVWWVFAEEGFLDVRCNCTNDLAGVSLCRLFLISNNDLSLSGDAGNVVLL